MYPVCTATPPNMRLKLAAGGYRPRWNAQWRPAILITAPPARSNHNLDTLRGRYDSSLTGAHCISRRSCCLSSDTHGLEQSGSPTQPGHYRRVRAGYPCKGFPRARGALHRRWHCHTTEPASGCRAQRDSRSRVFPPIAASPWRFAVASRTARGGLLSTCATPTDPFLVAHEREAKGS